MKISWPSALGTALLIGSLPASAQVVNVNAAVSNYYNGVVTSPATLSLNAGCYSVVDAFGKAGATYDSFNFHLGVANDWAWQYRVVDVATSDTLLYVAAPTNETPAQTYSSESAASTAGLAMPAGAFCVDATTTVGFVIDDNYAPDNTGGVSLSVTATQIVNVSAAVSNYYNGVLTNPVTVGLDTGCYEVYDAFGMTGASYQAFNYHGTSRRDWAWQFNVVDTATSASLLYVAAPANESPATKYATAAAASKAALRMAPNTFCLTAPTTVGFAIYDNFPSDNTGGVSVALTAH